MFHILFCIPLLIPIIIKIYLKLTTKWCRSHKCLIGKTAIVTGANTGIGFETALDFAKRGAKVILACRDLKKAETARLEIISRSENPNVFVKIIDFTSFKSVRDFAKNVYETENRLNILVNNAAVAPENAGKTEDGFYEGMQVNYLSLFLLTNLLLNLLKKSEPSRIVNVSSNLAKTTLFFNPEKLGKYYGNVDIYSRSKIAIIYFTQELAKKLQQTKITTYSLHPGTVKTEIWRHANEVSRIIIFGILKKFFGKTAEEGAQTNIYCSVEQNIERFSGSHFEECQKVTTYPNARNSKIREKLWQISEELVDLKSEEKFHFY